MQQLLNYLEANSPTQFKKVKAVADELGEMYENDVAGFLAKYTPYWNSIGLQMEEILQAYLSLCNQYMYYQIRFHKSGQYPVEKDRKATLEKIEQMYSQGNEMKSYMAGLSLSLVLWKSHYLLHRFFIDALNKYQPEIKQYLEVGTGHGFYFETAYEILQNHSKMGCVEISPVSIELTRSLMHFFHPGVVFNVEKTNFLDYGHRQEKVDFITLGEVIEHVEDPRMFLKKTHDLLTPDGKVYITTCINCPMIDHLYRFNSVEDIRQLFSLHGFEIRDELIVPTENLPWEEIVKNKITINYGAVLSKK
jgi:2-polyprenyl-3-methyl-5-hydroxy-6-metoxy-1,4-benzoquinol methylase